MRRRNKDKKHERNVKLRRRKQDKKHEKNMRKCVEENKKNSKEEKLNLNKKIFKK